ncbi:MAG TPA: tetratricopeptide repeat protein [Acidobacteriaceae bacterium]|nr:tetratricopeptide repeat protein [Acidobacteriaceae bacterium]
MNPRTFIHTFFGVMLLLLCLLGVGHAAPANGPTWDGRLVLVLPFENQSAQPGLDWIGESFPVILNERLNSAGFLTIRREDRQYALQHLGLPAGFHPTHATIYRIAQTLDVDYVILGSYTIANGHITAVARILMVRGPAMGTPLEENAGLNQLLDVEDGLAWQIARQIDPNFAVEKQTFLAAGHGIRLDTFENYVRGQMAPTIDEQIRHLSIAVQLSPDYTPALLALGKAYFKNQQYEQAAAAFAKIPSGNPRTLEAQFYSGLAYLYTGNYPKAEAAFSAVAAVLPLPEVLNNQGIALNRRGQDGTALFERAVKLDPQNANYWFNLAVSERRVKHYPRALEAVKKSLAIRPGDEEVQHLQEHLLAEENSPIEPDPAKISKPTPPADTTDTADATDATDATDNSEDTYEPLERIERTYNETSFRQAAFEMDQMRALKLQSLPPAKQAAELCKEGQGYVNQGLLLEAERQFQQALIADHSSAAAHAGLAQIREFTGNTAAARQQANTSIQLQPNVQAYLVLARLSLQQRQFTAATQSVQSALQLDPKNSAASGILQAIQVQEKQAP